MALLIDTCAAIWLTAGAQVSKQTAEAIDEALSKDENILVCPFTSWEVGMLCAKGRLALIKGPIGWYNDLVAMAGFEETFLSPEIMVLSSFLEDNPPNDPGDRIIIATAKKYDATIITRDKKILAYAAAGNCKALEC